MRIRTVGAALLALALAFPTRIPVSPDTPPPLPSDPLTTIRGTVRRGETLASVLAAHVSAAFVEQLLRSALPLYDLARITAGRPFGITLGSDGLLRGFSYGIDELQTLRVVRKSDTLRAEIVRREYDTRVSLVSGAIESSLFGAIEELGEGDQLALDLADIFAWDVDFNTEIQSGDSFRALVEKQYLDGQLVRYRRIRAAEFVRGGRVLRAFRHEGAAGVGYYDPEGRSLRKAFLRSPLRFTRISSRFSNSRLHPILRVRRPHLGVDYAAPAGTPVHAAADGLVVLAGWLGGYGKTVRLRHANGYETLYGHLSRITVVRGRRVAQGTVLGAVGATGLATGPHLDYRMVRSGRFVDPLRLQMPPAEPVARSERAAFRQAVAQLSPLLSAPGAGPTLAAVPH
jgi:murein DD-endopeptidase MepM/ murein hydrolase activator NlpD